MGPSPTIDETDPRAMSLPFLDKSMARVRPAMLSRGISQTKKQRRYRQPPMYRYPKFPIPNIGTPKLPESGRLKESISENKGKYSRGKGTARRRTRYDDEKQRPRRATTHRATTIPSGNPQNRPRTGTSTNTRRARATHRKPEEHSSNAQTHHQQAPHAHHSWAVRIQPSGPAPENTNEARKDSREWWPTITRRRKTMAVASGLRQITREKTKAVASGLR